MSGGAMSGMLQGAGQAPSPQGGFMQNLTGALGSPMFQAGLATLATNTGGQRGQGGRSVMHGLTAFNQAQRFQAVQKQQQAMIEKQKQAAAQEQARRQAMPQLMQDLLGAKTPEDKIKAAAGMLQYDPGMASGMLSQAFPDPAKQSAFAEKLDLAGIDPGTPEGQQDVRSLLMKPSVSVNVGTTKPLKASDLKNYQDKTTGKTPPPGSTQQDLIDGNYEVVTSKPTSESGRVAMARQGITRIDDIRKELIKNGELDRIALASMSVPGTKLNSLMTEAISSNVYLKTGAAATAGEIQAQMDIYKPRMWSSLETSGEMLSRLEEFFRLTAEGSGAPSGTTEQAVPSAEPTPQQLDEVLKKYGIGP